ncbi:MAG: C1 family peptidase [Syntrophales bacterium]
MKLRSVLALSVILVVPFSVPSFVSGVLADRGELDKITRAISQKNSRWTEQQTSISSLTSGERKKRLGSKYPPFSLTERVLIRTSPSLPVRLDWRNYSGTNYVTPVKDQGDCGACWAFAVSAALESKVLITRNIPNALIDLSEQVLTSCSNAGNCDAGYINLASDFISNYGLPPEDCAPYTASNRSCANGYPGWASKAYTVPGWSLVAPNVAAIRDALYSYGPLVALMAVNTDFFYYGSGIYSHAWGDFEGYHAALIVGYDDAEQSFIVKGSWGAEWGEAGYFRIAYNEISSQTVFGCWLLAYNSEIPSDFPTVEGIPRSAGGSAAEGTIDSVSTNNATTTGQETSLIFQNGTKQEDSTSIENDSGIPSTSAIGTSANQSVARTGTEGHPVIGYTSQMEVIDGQPQMLLKESQTLLAAGGCGGPYTWSIVRGSGTLSALIGDSITYTAPAANTYCEYTPTIRLVDSCGYSGLLTIAVTQFNNPGEIALKTWEPFASCSCLGDSSCNCFLLKKQYNCQSEKITECVAGTQSNNTNGGPSCGHCMEDWLFSNCGTEAPYARLLAIGREDFRTNVMKYYSCCPARLLSRLGSPTDPGTHDIGGSCPNDPRSPNADWESAANVKTGNLYFSSNVAGLTLTYNSLDSYNGPLGKKWTHDYNLKLLIPVSHTNTIRLKTHDGNIIFFSLVGSTYYPDAISGDTSQIARNPDASFTRTFKSGLIQHFNHTGSLISITDRNGNMTVLAYSGNDLVRITDPNGRITTITATDGKIASIVDAGGRAYSLNYTDGLLTSVSGPVGYSWQYTYDVNGLMQTKTDPGGNTINYEYYTNGWMKKTIAPDGTRSMTYTHPGTAIITEKDGSSWTYQYDHTYSVKTQKTDPLGNTTTYFYDQKRNLTSTMEPDGSTTSYIYDTNGNVTSVTLKDPQGAVVSHISYEYNSMNLIMRSTDPKGDVTSYGYNTKGNLTSVVAPVGTTLFQYDVRGNVTAMADPNNRTTLFAYDAQNNLTSITDPLGNATSFTYDTVGNRLTMTEPMGQITRFFYNALDQLTQVTDPKGNVTAFTYDYRGKVLSTTDANGRPTRYEYNYRGQLTRITDALNKLTQLSYGPASCGSGCGGAEKVTSLTDALNHTTRYDYDLAGRLIKETDPNNRETDLTRDARGRLLTRTKPDGRTITYTYDAANRLTRKQYPDGSTSQYQYDASGNMTYAGNAAIAYSFAYDASNRLSGVTDSNSRTIQYQYDPAGNRTATITPENRTIAYSYDAARRLTAISADNLTFAFGYDVNSRRTGLSMPNGSAAAYAYDNNGNLIRIRHTGQGDSVLAEINYTYDPVDNRLTQTDTATPGTESAGTEIMTHGTANELLMLNTTTYGYDPNGNRNRKTETAGETIYVYDDEHRLVRVEKNGGTQLTTYTYDPLGRRIEKNVNGTVTRYLYDGEDILLEYDQAGTVITRYIHGPGIDEPLTMERNGELYYYHADDLGSIIVLTNSTGTVVQSYRYDAFGNILNGMPTVVQPYTYAAREYDPETGLYFYRARYYDPKAGRFITKDPIGFAGGINVYAYVNNNPVRYIDPMGLYNEDVHLYDTFHIGVSVGISPRTADAIAMYNNLVDERYPVIYYSNRKNWHFVTQQRVAVLLNNAFSSCDTEAFGEALHSLQDYYSHTLQGYKPFLGHMTNPDAPDVPANNLNLYNQMLVAIKNAVKQFKDKCLCGPAK